MRTGQDLYTKERQEFLRREQPKTLEEKRQAAIAWLRERGLYILDRGSKKPSWAHSGDAQP